MKFYNIICVLLITFLSQTATSQIVTNFVDLPNPDDLEVDRFGNLWANYKSTSIPATWHLVKISHDGTIENIITEPHELGMFGINDSIIWITGPWGPDSYIYKYNHSGVKLDSVYMPAPTAMILDPDGTLYVTQNAFGRLVKVNPDNSTQILASGQPLDYNLALARDEEGFFYTCNLGNSRVIKIDPDTGVKTIIASLPAPAQYNLGFLSYSQGNLYVPSWSQHCIYKVRTDGSGFVLFAGKPGVTGDINGPISDAVMNLPLATAFSVTGDTMYYTDSGNRKIKLVYGMNSVTSSKFGDELSNYISLYPNPALESINIELKAENDSILLLEILNETGTILSSFKVPDSSFLKQHTHSIATLPSGSYLMNITTVAGKHLTRKFIKS